MPKSSQKDRPSSVISELPSLSHFSVDSSTRIATLWFNYGSIDRVYLRNNSSTESGRSSGRKAESVIFKTVTAPPLRAGEHADEGHLRKLLSYQVERYFYSHLSSCIPKQAKVARFYPTQSSGEEDGTRPVQIVLEDLSVEYPNPARGSLNLEDTGAVLGWLATFHGTFWGVQNEQGIKSTLIPPPLQHKGGNEAGIWEQGTYWYLDTRREELSNTNERHYGWLLKWVGKVDAALKTEARTYGTLLHGDVKGANIVFARDSSTLQDTQSRCALYDFQYAGVGLVTRDLVYFLGTTVQSGLLRKMEQEKELLCAYHADLVQSVGSRRERANGMADDENAVDYSFSQLWGHWELALVDWCRFMAGWGFWGNDSWVERRAKEIVSNWDVTGFPYSDQ